MNDREELRRRLAAAHAEALRVGDSPIRADRVADEVSRIAGSLGEVQLEEDTAKRMDAALADVLRVLRRDDDGREAARHLQAALRLLEGGPRRPSPFFD